MKAYKCFKCGREIKTTDLDKRFVCPICGSKIFYKSTAKTKTVKAI